MAMELLNHTKNNGLGKLIGKYEHFAHEIQEALMENKKALNKLKKATEDAIYEGQESIKGVAVDAQRTVKRNPWAFIGAASACALVVGFMLGKKK